MNTKRYKAELTLLNKKDEQGKFFEKKQVVLLDIINYGEVKIAFQYEGKKRKPDNYVAIYQNVVVILKSAYLSFEDFMQELENIASDTRNVETIIINRYKELKLI